MQDRPRHVQERIRGEVKAVQQVVPGHDNHPEDQQRSAWQPDQRRERKHAQANGPDHLQVNHARRELEGPGEVDQRQFQHHQKQAAREQERRHSGLALIFLAVQVRGQPGQQYKHRGTEVGEGATDKEGRLCAVNRHRICHLPVQEKRFPHVVQQHEQNHQPAQGVDGQQTLMKRRCSSQGMGHWQGHTQGLIADTGERARPRMVIL